MLEERTKLPSSKYQNESLQSGIRVGSSLGKILQKSPFYKSMMTILIFSLLFLLSINGLTEKAIDHALQLNRVSKANEEFSKRSLVSATGHFAAMSATKGFLTVISGTDLKLAPVGVGGGIPVGKLLEPAVDSVDALWKFFGYSMVSIVTQMTLLKFLKLLSIKVLVSLGSVLVVASIFSFSKLLKFGYAFVLVGFILYVLAPYTVFSGKVLFEESNIVASATLSEDIGVLKEKISDIDIFAKENLSIKGAKGTFMEILLAMSNAFDIVLNGAIKYFGNLIIMFILLPLFFYGLIYLTIKQTLSYIGMQDFSQRMDISIIAIAKKSFAKKKSTKAVPMPKHAVQEG